MKRHWLVIDPDTFIWTKNKEGLMYNAANYAKLHFENTGEVARLVQILQDIDRLYRVSLTGEQLENKAVKTWIDSILESGNGRLVEDDGSGKRPVSLKPVLKVQDGVEYYEWEHRRGIDGNIIHNLHKLTFHINGSTSGNEAYARQFAYPVKTNARLEKDAILTYVRHAGRSDLLTEITLIGDPCAYPEIDELLGGITGHGFAITFYCTGEDFLNYARENAAYKSDAVCYRLLITDGIVPDGLAAHRNRPDIRFDFIVTSTHEYAAAVRFVEKHEMERIRILPAYNGRNLDFFKEYVYTDRNQLLGAELSKREIFIRQTLNIFWFGQLVVAADGRVYAGPGNTPVGRIDETPHQAVYREMTEGDSWLQVRDQAPCHACIYQWLCPSPSGYEPAIGKYDLCRLG